VGSDCSAMLIISSARAAGTPVHRGQPFDNWPDLAVPSPEAGRTLDF